MPVSPLRVCIISAARSDEGIYLPLIQAMKEDSGMTLSDAMDCDWMVVLGDTWPMLKATIQSVKQNIPVAHIHGGDRTGSIDESIRHAITRFAHLHFPSIKEHADRLIRMGEEAWRIETVGPLGIYAMKDKIVPDHSYDIIVIQHPVSTQVEQAGEQMKATLEAVLASVVCAPFDMCNPGRVLVIHPNGDPGSEAMLDVIQQFPFKHVDNLPYLNFLSFLAGCKVIVGNSSCGLVEAPAFSIPCVNVGTRQGARRSGVAADVNCDTAQIKDAIEYYLNRRGSLLWHNPYLGYENGPAKIIAKLKNTPVNEKLLQKVLTY